MGALTVYFILATAQNGLPQNLLEALCYVESKYNINAVHAHDGDGNSVGICQVKLKTARFMGFKGTEKELMQPDVNIYYAGAYLRHQVNRYHGDLRKAVIAYNQGSAKALTTTQYQIKVYNQWRGK